MKNISVLKTGIDVSKIVEQLNKNPSDWGSQKGIDKFRVIMDKTNNTERDARLNRLVGTIILVPTRAVEFIAIDFILTNSGVSFE